MLKKEVAEKIKSFGFDVDKLIAAIKDEAEVDYTLPDVQVFKTADLEARDNNTKAEGEKEGFKKGKETGIIVAGKALAKKFNLPETVDVKEPDKVAEAISTNISKGDAGLQEQIKLLQKDKETLLSEKENIIKEKEALAFDTSIISYFPANRDASLEDSERLMLVKHALQFETVDGKQVVKKNGEILRNPTTKDPLPVKDAINTLFTERKWVAESGGGRGGQDNPGGRSSGGLKKFSDVQAQWQKDNPGVNHISPEFTAYVGGIAKETTDFDWNN
jgi:hypothetical protein